VNQHHKSDKDIQFELQQITAAKENPAHFNVLYEKYFKSIYVFVHRRTDDEELASDITSHVFLKAMVNIKKYEYKGMPFSAWLFRIAFNEVNMYFRKNKGSRVVSIEQSGIVLIAHEAAMADNTEKLAMLTAALQKLDSNDVQLIELRFFEKRSFAEVGEIVGITENNAKVKIYRIIDKLKRLMKL
jgi:RNA polymerase sigma-70 factor (ECF subfamily)